MQICRSCGTSMAPDQIVCPTCRAPQRSAVPGHRRGTRLFALAVLLAAAGAILIGLIYWWMR